MGTYTLEWAELRAPAMDGVGPHAAKSCRLPSVLLGIQPGGPPWELPGILPMGLLGGLATGSLPGGGLARKGLARSGMAVDNLAVNSLAVAVGSLAGQCLARESLEGGGSAKVGLEGECLAWVGLARELQGKQTGSVFSWVCILFQSSFQKLVPDHTLFFGNARQLAKGSSAS